LEATGQAIPPGSALGVVFGKEDTNIWRSTLICNVVEVFYFCEEGLALVKLTGCCSAVLY